MTYYTQDYSLWDTESTTSCVCDIGFTGSACSMSKFLQLYSLKLDKCSTVPSLQKFVPKAMTH
jgi:hypothetical protein